MRCEATQVCSDTVTLHTHARIQARTHTIYSVIVDYQIRATGSRIVRGFVFTENFLRFKMEKFSNVKQLETYLWCFHIQRHKYRYQENTFDKDYVWFVLRFVRLRLIGATFERISVGREMLVVLKSALCCGRAVNMMANVLHFITLGPAYNELCHSEHPVTTSRYFSQKRTFLIYTYRHRLRLRHR